MDNHDLKRTVTMWLKSGAMIAGKQHKKTGHPLRHPVLHTNQFSNLDQALVNHRIGHLDEAGDIGAHDVVAHITIFL